MQALVDKEGGSISLLFDMAQFKWEDIDAWGADFNFGRTYRKIDKMAVVGNKTWQKWLTEFVELFYHSVEARFFDPMDIEAA